MDLFVTEEYTVFVLYFIIIKQKKFIQYHNFTSLECHFYQKNKIIVFKKKVQNKKIEDFFLRKKQNYSVYYSVRRKLKK